MKRRNFVVGLGTLAVGAGSVVRSGAFTGAEAQRTVTVETADDDKAYLQFEPTGIYGRSSLVTSPIGDPDAPEILKFRIPGPEEDEDLANFGGADGIGLDSQYFFGELVDIRNAGTKPMKVTTDFNDPKGSVTDVDFYRSGSAPQGRIRESPVTLDVGDEERLGLYLKTGHTDLGEFDVGLRIIAKAIEE